METNKCLIVFDKGRSFSHDKTSFTEINDENSISKSAQDFLNDLDSFLDRNDNDSLTIAMNFNRSQSLKQSSNKCFHRTDMKRQTVSEFRPVIESDIEAKKFRKYPVSGNINELVTANATDSKPIDKPEDFNEKFLQYCTMRKKSTKKHSRTNSAPDIHRVTFAETERERDVNEPDRTRIPASDWSTIETLESRPDNRHSDEILAPIVRNSSFSCNNNEIVLSTSTLTNSITNNTENLNNQSEQIRSHQDQQNQSEKQYFGLSSMTTSLGCTIGLFSINRFAINSVNFGGTFVVQFFIMSLIIGIPMFTLQQTIGRKLKSNVLSMWFISPVFRGIGFAMLIAQIITGIYSVVSLSWLIVYFCEAFNAVHDDSYSWNPPITYTINNGHIMIVNSSIVDSVPNFWNQIVLQRQNYDFLTNKQFGNVKFQSAFNLAVIWMIILVALSKSVKSYKVSFSGFLIMAIVFFTMFHMKIISLVPGRLSNKILPDINWPDFFRNKSWTLAAQEAFLSWCLFSPAIMQISAETKNRSHLKRNLKFVILMTSFLLVITASIAHCCLCILNINGFSYQSSSYETLSNSHFLKREDLYVQNTSSNRDSLKSFRKNVFIVGDQIYSANSDRATQSGYQVLRFATELIPATISLAGFENISSFWTVKFYLALIFFGIVQQLVVWNSVISGIIAINVKQLKNWEITITFFSCVCGFLLGLPFTTDFGIRLMYLFDHIIGGNWWLMLLFLMQILIVFLIRGRPYTGDILIKELFDIETNNSILTIFCSTFLTFAWSVILPISLMILCVSQFKSNDFGDFYRWNGKSSYWTLNEKKFGSIIQISLLFIVPAVAVIQCYRYITNGPDDILERIQLLYRPNIWEDGRLRNRNETIEELNMNGPSARSAEIDLPPKYSPPPSYTTATGAQLAKLVRQSIRRTMRRVNNLLNGENSRPAAISDSPVVSSAVAAPQTQQATIVQSTVAEIAYALRSSFRMPTDCSRNGNYAGTARYSEA